MDYAILAIMGLARPGRWRDRENLPCIALPIRMVVLSPKRQPPLIGFPTSFALWRLKDL